MPAICVMGESGSGKTTSMRNLDPQSTYYIDCDKKGLSWKGWKTQYNLESKNYHRSSDAQQITEIIYGINAKRPAIKTVVVDTLNAVMIDDEMLRMREKGYDKWIDVAMSVWGIIHAANETRDDLKVIFIAHTQTDYDDNGFRFTHMKTNGRKLDKIVLESKFTTVLLAKCVNGRYIFETYANNSTAKTPLDCYSTAEREIDNDISSVLKRLEEY